MYASSQFFLFCSSYHDFINRTLAPGKSLLTVECSGFVALIRAPVANVYGNFCKHANYDNFVLHYLDDFYFNRGFETERPHRQLFYLGLVK